MSPELFHPEKFGLKDARPTKQSDCYAFGMVIYEVLSGQAPFAPLHGCVVVGKVIEGERPGRPNGPEGAQFTDDLWQTLSWCWTAQPQCRPCVTAVFECLERVSNSLKTPSQHSEESTGTDEDGWDVVSDSSDMVSRFNPRYLFAILCGILCLSQLRAISRRILPRRRGGTELGTPQPTAFTQIHS